ncbi:MAG: DUF302 domain-containing protein [Chloroflexota bacterium]
MNWLSLIIGFIVGAVVIGLAAWKMMPKMMMEVHKSRLGFEETVEAVEKEALSRGWNVPKIYNIQKTLTDAGHADMTRAKIISICQPDHAYNILRFDENKFVTGIMPCRVGIYETADGVYIAEMNMGLMSKMFGSTIEQVMGQVAAEEKEMMSGIVAAA